MHCIKIFRRHTQLTKTPTCITDEKNQWSILQLADIVFKTDYGKSFILANEGKGTS